MNQNFSLRYFVDLISHPNLEKIEIYNGKSIKCRKIGTYLLEHRRRNREISGPASNFAMYETNIYNDHGQSISYLRFIAYLKEDLFDYNRLARCIFKNGKILNLKNFIKER